MYNRKYALCPQSRFDKKWLRIDPQFIIHSEEHLNSLWNTLISDGELVGPFSEGTVNANGGLAKLSESGKHYCGMMVLNCLCCDGICGPNKGCNCSACKALDEEISVIKGQNEYIPSEQYMDTWLWGPPPSTEQKQDCIKSILHELDTISQNAAGTCLSSIRITQRVTIMQRYMAAVCRNLFNYDNKYGADAVKSVDSASVFNSHKDVVKQINSAKDATNHEKVLTDLARVGSRAALSFSFAFLRRAWRSGEDTDICTELLSEALDSLQSLPMACLFKHNTISPIWLEILDRSHKFLKQIVLGDGQCGIPKADQNISLCLLFELCAQRGVLSSLLECVSLLLALWNKECSEDNRSSSQLSSAPLVSILQRIEALEPEDDICNLQQHHKNPKTSNINLKQNENYQNLNITTSPTQCFLRFLSLPNDASINMDLKQSAVIVMCHLDRLTLSYTDMIKNNCEENPVYQQRIEHQGMLPWQDKNLIRMSELGVKKIVCGQKKMLLLSNKGKLYMLDYSAGAEPQIVQGRWKGNDYIIVP
ncbi:probable E3 ubiquitin-protein ligase HERC2 [Ctenocephalides felis]|uniref:probable E3 ubiquitin-protein ligase HERC2 n=1 Tax=Ctenocephalides felis TaxID=7515 RepID=UPI000E6E1697|nr:probable E3 ubiquitin-protein ligase HERC2 [Ctenocephalides felis]